MPGSLLLDISCLCDEHTDSALELMHKAMGEEPPGVDIWSPHPNPFIRRIVELFTERGLERIAGLQDELNRWLRGEEFHAGLERPARPDGVMARWSRSELALVRLYLQTLPPERFTLDDWMMLVDYLAQRYLPETDLRAEADWLATRSAMMGRVQAAMGDTTEARIEAVLANLPAAQEIAAKFVMTPAQRAVVDFGRARCAESVTGLADGARRKLRRAIVDYQEAEYLGIRSQTSEALQTKLLDQFGAMNRDWRRIAITEATENANQGFVASQPVGSKLRRVEKYRGACAFCRGIDGKVVTVVAPSTTPQDGDNTIWVGKSNVGRSASPRRREAGFLVERQPHERWWIAAGAQHPHCRGSWVCEVEGVAPDPEFEAFLASLERKGRS